MNPNLNIELKQIITEARRCQSDPEPYIYLAPIIENLDRLAEELSKKKPDSRRVEKLTGGIVRLVTEEFSFSEGPLGSRVLDFLEKLE